jgi:translation initiation factor 6 (eIF-6)
MLVQKVGDVTAIAIIVIAVAIVKTELRVAIIRIVQKKLQILVSQTRIAHVRQVGDVTAVSAINSKSVTIKHPPNKLRVQRLT